MITACKEHTAVTMANDASPWESRQFNASIRQGKSSDSRSLLLTSWLLMGKTPAATTSSQTDTNADGVVAARQLLSARNRDAPVRSIPFHHFMGLQQVSGLGIQ